MAVKKKELPPNPMVHELLEAVDSERVKTKKISLLKQHGDNSVKSLFIWNLDLPNMSFVREKSCTQLQIYRFNIVQNARSFVPTHVMNAMVAFLLH